MDVDESSKTIRCWVELYADSMYSWALYKTSSKETAEDLVQDTFMAALQSYDSYKNISNPKSWLFSILNNKLQGFYRDRYRMPLHTNEGFYDNFFEKSGSWKPSQKPLEWTGDPSHLLDDGEFQNVLNDCLKKLPKIWLTVIQNKIMEGKKGDVICQDLGITDTNYWQILHRAKLQLRKCLESNWFKK